MAANTKVEWTDRTWSPVTGCTKISPGCDHCYAERMAQRLRGRFGYPQDDPFVVTWHPDKLEEPSHWRKPQRVFVCSMSDLFHPRVPWEFIQRIFEVMEEASQHTFQVLTKRPGRMAYFADHEWQSRYGGWPSNVWAGTSVESAKYLPRLDALARVPAKVRFVSCEPLLGPLDLRPWLLCKTCNGSGFYSATEFCSQCSGSSQGSLHWTICGGESGPSARPMHPQWARGIRDQCQEAGVPLFFKQSGEYLLIREARQRGLTWTRERNEPSSGFYMAKVGKKAAGALLDGREWKEMPA